MKPNVVVSCHPVHHGAAASSHRHAVGWVSGQVGSEETSGDFRTKQQQTDRNYLAYTSHANVLLAEHCSVELKGNQQVQDHVWNVSTTLRTSLLESSKNRDAKNIQLPGGNPIVSSMATATSTTEKSEPPCIACGFSSGLVNCWVYNGTEWIEYYIATATRSVSSIAARWKLESSSKAAAVDGTTRTLWIVAGTSSGASLHQCRLPVVTKGSGVEALVEAFVTTVPLFSHAVCSVSFSKLDLSSPLVLIGTASPRHNQIHVYRLDDQDDDTKADKVPAPVSIHSMGTLAGHEDWITDMDWWIPPVHIHATVPEMQAPLHPLLASASQDARIRLWMFQSVEVSSNLRGVGGEEAHEAPSVEATDDDDDEWSVNDEAPDEDGEARMEIILPSASDKHTTTIIRVTLEAILMGHEESVTSVQWHPNPRSFYGADQLLISSSMDRAIMLWGPTTDGIWTPLTRVGSAGGILGGSVGSSLLGYCSATVDPWHGQWLVGHAYGGSLHFWSLSVDEMSIQSMLHHDGASNDMSMEERASFVNWKAASCVTGHFDHVTDLCWETSRGEYLLSVSHDQTCRLWAPVPKKGGRSIWVELARPQVHGYNLSAITSISSLNQKHTIVTGADEKELRVFDAPRTTLRILQAACGIEHDSSQDESIERVQRAYIPSLGLSNKASASDGAEEADVEGMNTNHAGLEASNIENMRLPLERDLGAVSLWPEGRKLFGHNTELFCLASTLEARKALHGSFPPRASNDILVASSCKARDVEAAQIRIWNVATGKCVQILKGGHKATVATLAFSPDGQYLASSGKDRRLCLWSRSPSESPDLFKLAWAKDTAHKRIIWCVGFCPHEPSMLASGSRDGCVRIWKISPNKSEEPSIEVSERFQFAPSFRKNSKPDAVTALAFAPVQSRGTALLALGLESGRIELFGLPLFGETPAPQLLAAFPTSFCHVATVTKLAWKPLVDKVVDGDNCTLLLASSSQDCGTRVAEVVVLQ